MDNKPPAQKRTELPRFRYKLAALPPFPASQQVVGLINSRCANDIEVVSDWGAQHTGTVSALSGLDMAMPGGGGGRPYFSLWGGALTEAVLNGSVPQWRLDDMAVRIMAAHYRVSVGNFSSRPEINFSSWTNKTVGPLHPSANDSWAVVNKHVDVQGDHGKLIREIGAKSIVLLKNSRNTLPLSKPRSIAIIGEDAQDTPGGANSCKERGCNNGTLAMAWGSGTAEFPYLISPATALKLRAEKDGSAFANISSNWNRSAARAAALNSSVALVFANANAGENFITIGGNAGDRNNLTLWNGGEDLIRAVAAVNNNTIVVLHTVGPVIIEFARQHPNISAILWAGLPGQESGNSLVDVLYGEVNPQGRSPFTWGAREEDWDPIELLYKASNPRQPNQTLSEGVFIDYRHFQRANITPSYEFGFGMSYTSFHHSNLSIVTHNTTTYKGANGMTTPAQTYGRVDRGREANMAPKGFRKVLGYVYPWLENLRAPNSTGALIGPDAGRNSSAQPLHPAGGSLGGNEGLYDVVYTISAAIRNTGRVFGTEIPQLVRSLFLRSPLYPIVHSSSTFLLSISCLIFTSLSFRDMSS